MTTTSLAFRSLLVTLMVMVLFSTSIAQAPSLGVNSIRFDCTANTGSATITVSNSNGPFTYDLNGSTYTASTNPFTITNIPASPNDVIIPVTGNAGYIGDLDLVIKEIGLSGATISGCGTLGSVVAQFPFGGSGTYEYRLNSGNWQQNQTFTNLTPGDYTLEIRDFFTQGCTKVIGTYTVTASGTPPVITFSEQHDIFCNNITVTANVSPAGTYDYNWSSGQSTSSINLNTTAASGNYTVSVSNGSGCSQTATYSHSEPDKLMAYNVLATNDITMGQANIVNGSVGNTTAGKTVAVNKGSIINGYIRSAIIKLTAPVTVAQGSITTAAAFALPANKTNTATLPSTNVTIPDNGTATLSANYNNITIGKAAKVTLTGTIFGKVTIKEGADVTFSQSDINIGDIITFAGKAGVNYTTLNFPNATTIRIKNGVVLEDRNIVNSNNGVFYMSNTKSGAEKFTVNSTDTKVNAGIYMPVGKLAVRGTVGGCIMTGTYIAQSIYSDKGVTWNSVDCNNLSARSSHYVNRLTPALQHNSEALQVQAFPNPSANDFTLQLNKTTAEPIVVKIYDATGHFVYTASYMAGNIRLGATLKAGTYYAQITQANRSQVIKLVKQ